MVPTVALAALVAATSTSSTTGAQDDPRCGFTETYRVVGEWRAGEPGSQVTPLRRDSGCEQYWYATHSPLGLVQKRALIADDLERGPGPSATVHFRGEPGLQLYVESRRSRYLDNHSSGDRTQPRRRVYTRGRLSEYRLLAEHAGTATLAEGTHFFALARADEPLIEVQRTFEVSGPLHLEGRATSYTDARLVAGTGVAVGMLGLIVAGVWTAAESAGDSADMDFTAPSILAAGGIAITVIGGTLLALAFDDETSLEVTPHLASR